MREFIPSDYVDKEGNVYETVGENIREGKNSLIASGFPTPEEIGTGGFVGSDGAHYTVKGVGLANTENLVERAYVLRYKNNQLIYEDPITSLDDSTKSTTPPTSKSVVDYVKSKLSSLSTPYKTYQGILKVSDSGAVSIEFVNEPLLFTASTSENDIIISSNGHNVIDVKILAMGFEDNSQHTQNTPIKYGYFWDGNTNVMCATISKVNGITADLMITIF